MPQIQDLPHPQRRRHRRHLQQPGQLQSQELPHQRRPRSTPVDQLFTRLIDAGLIDRPLITGLGDQHQFTHLGVQPDPTILGKRGKHIISLPHHHPTGHVYDYTLTSSPHKPRKHTNPRESDHPARTCARRNRPCGTGHAPGPTTAKPPDSRLHTSPNTQSLSLSKGRGSRAAASGDASVLHCRGGRPGNVAQKSSTQGPRVEGELVRTQRWPILDGSSGSAPTIAPAETNCARRTQGAQSTSAGAGFDEFSQRARGLTKGPGSDVGPWA